MEDGLRTAHRLGERARIAPAALGLLLSLVALLIAGTLKLWPLTAVIGAVDLPLAMTAHVVYTAIDPERPATTSKTVIDEVIRGVIGYDGCLMSDDVSMQARNCNVSGAP